MTDLRNKSIFREVLQTPFQHHAQMRNCRLLYHYLRKCLRQEGFESLGIVFVVQNRYPTQSTIKKASTKRISTCQLQVMQYLLADHVLSLYDFDAKPYDYELAKLMAEIDRYLPGLIIQQEVNKDRVGSTIIA